MATVTYNGTSDKRVLTSSDLKSLQFDGEFSKTEFVQGESVEVSDEVAEFLKTHAAFAGEFVDGKPADQGEPALTDSGAEGTSDTDGSAAADVASSSSRSTSGRSGRAR